MTHETGPGKWNLDFGVHSDHPKLYERGDLVEIDGTAAEIETVFRTGNGWCSAYRKVDGGTGTRYHGYINPLPKEERDRVLRDAIINPIIEHVKMPGFQHDLARCSTDEERTEAIVTFLMVERDQP